MRKKILWACLLVSIIFTIWGVRFAMSVEEAKYKLIKKENHFEIRDYDSHILAETLIEGNLEDAGNKSFNILFNYISGQNKSKQKVAMTAPVSQESVGEKIKMTAPVEQQRVQDKWAVSFMMPASYTLETLPMPTDEKVTLRQIPARRMAMIRYSGLWSEKNYLRYKTELETWIKVNNLTIIGEAVWARYNPPFTPWFLRRNEILIPITSIEKIQ